MADISTYTEAISKSPKGEYVRDSIIRALESITFGGNAHTLEGKTVDELVTGKTLQDAIARVTEVVDTINAKLVEGGITTKLNWMAHQKDEIIQAIIDMGVNVTPNDTLADLADRILQIYTDFDLDTLDVTENGSYSASNEGVDGFDEVIVDVQPEMIDFMIVENGTYRAKSEGVDGFSSVEVDVLGLQPDPEDEGPFDVMFYDDDGVTVLQYVENVPKGGSVTYTGPTPVSKISEDFVFIGWNPNPVNVTYNMVCYPEFQDKYMIVNSSEITDTWNTVLDNNGELYDVGSYKLLRLEPASNILSPDGYSDYIDYKPQMVIMQKVATGENGTSSTWLSVTLPPEIKCCAMGPASSSSAVYYSWDICDLRKWLNNQFFNIMIPEKLRDKIKPVTKYTYKKTGYYPNLVINKNLETIDKIWIPSRQEMETLEDISEVDELDKTTLYHENIETNGVSYNFKNNVDRDIKVTDSDMLTKNRDGRVTGGLSRYLLRSTPISKYNTQNSISCIDMGKLSINAASNYEGYDTGASYRTGLVFGFCL